MQVQENIDLLDCNTLRLPCQARYSALIQSEQELEEAVVWARRVKAPLVVLGGGSNLILPKRLEAMVLRMAIPGIALRDCSGRGVELTVGAGENWHQLVTRLLRAGVYGLENLALIPGTVGAAPIQNIGAYGIELAQFVDSVRAFDCRNLEWRAMTAAECEFSYRDSLFRKDDRYIVSGLRLKLSRNPLGQDSYLSLRQELESQGIDKANPQQIYAAVVKIRQERLPDPTLLPNAGSFFKNPVVSAERHAQLRGKYPALVSHKQPDDTYKLAAAWLIEQAGFKGRSDHGVSMHHKQALVLVNEGNADASQVLAYASQVKERVLNQFGVKLEREPVLLTLKGQKNVDQ